MGFSFFLRLSESEALPRPFCFRKRLELKVLSPPPHPLSATLRCLLGSPDFPSHVFFFTPLFFCAHQELFFVSAPNEGALLSPKFLPLTLLVRDNPTMKSKNKGVFIPF